MKLRIAQTLLLTLVLAAAPGVRGQTAPRPSPSPAPLIVDKTEEERVRLVLMDVVVVDGDGRAVSGLTRDDFEIMANGEPVPIDTLDVHCPEGGLGDVSAIGRPGTRQVPPATDQPRKVVLAFDYLHMDQMQRTEVLETARKMVQQQADGEEILIAALNGGLRIEQTFNDDREQALRTLQRMAYDISLWQPDFYHVNETGFVSGLHMLFDVLGTVPGPKAVVLYSAMADVPLDIEFAEIAASAATSRCSIYPVDAMGLRTAEQTKAIRGGAG